MVANNSWFNYGLFMKQMSTVITLKSERKKTSAKAAIVEDMRRAKSPDVLAHRLSHLHNSHQGVGLGFGKHFLSIGIVLSFKE